jgi:Spy/CpxP family protein refolding chaperone
MWLTKLLAPTAAILVLSLGGTVVAAPKSLPQVMVQNTGDQQPQGQSMKDRLVQELNLTPDQAQKMQDIRTKYKDQLTQQHQALVQARTELRTLMAGTGSDDQIRDQYNKVQDLQNQFAKLAFEQRLEMRDILTPDQRHQADELMQARRQQFKERFRQQTEQQQSSN